MNKLSPIKFKGVVVITTKELARVYSCSERNISDNFNNNKSKFKEGIHYFKLEGEELKQFILQSENFGLQISSKTRIFYLWTHKGASRHCKMLGTDEAWNQFDILEENYFNPRQLQSPSYMIEDQIERAKQWIKEQEEKKLLEEEKNRLQIELDESKDYYSIKRVAFMNDISWRDLNWRKLKRESNLQGKDVVKIFDANYGEVNTYHRTVWEVVYPNLLLTWEE